MTSNCFPRLSLLIVLLILTIPALQLDWQGSGNMSQSNMTEIHTQISRYPISSTAMDVDIDTVAQAISTHLN